MTAEFVTQLPPGYDEKTQMGLTPGNDIVIAHPNMPPMIYDETEMRWVRIEPAKEKENP